MENKTIYFVCPDMRHPIGGIKQMYKQVDLLNQNGFNAYILHKKEGFRCTWFENQTKITYNRPIFTYLKRKLRKKPYTSFKKLFHNIVFSLQKRTAAAFDKNGILVFPEVFGGYVTEVEPNMPKIIYNQNCYYTFNANNFENDYPVPPYLSKQILAAIVVSDDSKKYMEFAFPSCPTFKIRNGINTDLFKYSTGKKKQIAFMPRKLSDDIVQIVNILKIRNNLPDWTFVSIENKSETEVARIMMESYIYLSLNQTEGFGLPPVEAMSCGCVVIGYTGLGGDEYFDPNYSFPVADRNIIAFAKVIEEVAFKINDGDTATLQKGKMASDTIQQMYSLAKEKEDTISVWKNICKAVTD